jgi:hypothetical protein
LSTKLKQKAVKLLRLAVDRADSPEGDTARRLAEAIIETHGFTVDPDEVTFEDVPEVAQVLFAEHEQRHWWQEMLLVTLCALYGGEVVSIGGEHHWRLYVVIEPNDEVDVPRLQEHFQFLSKLVFDLCDTCATEFMQALPIERERAVSSFRIGAVFRISQLLYQDSTGEEPDLQHMPFMVRALKEGEKDDAVDTLGPVEKVTSPEEDSKAPPASEIEEVTPDWHWFDCGWRCANRSILRVFKD